MCIYSKSSSRSLCYNSLPVTCVSVLIKCSVMPKSQLCTHARSSAFPCLFSRHFTECVFCIKKEQLANVLMKGNICVRAVASSPAEVHPALVKAQRRVTQISSGNSTQTGPHRHPQAHKHAESRTRSSAGAKVNR